jgi:hypothetical protein
MDDGGQPAAERVGAELRGREAEEHEDFEDVEMVAVEKREGDAEAGDGGEEGGVGAAAEADVQHGAEQEDPDATGEDSGRDGGDAGFGYVLRGEQLGKGEGDEARVEAEGEVGHAHQPEGGGEAAKVQTGLLGWRANRAWRLDGAGRWRVYGSDDVA